MIKIKDTHGLINAVLFGGVNVAFHFLKRSGKNGNYNKIGTRQRFFKRLGPIPPFSFS